LKFSGLFCQDQDQDFIFCPRRASRRRPWSRGQHTSLTRTFVDFVKSDLAFGSTSFLIVWSLMYRLIVLNTLIAASCPHITNSHRFVDTKLSWRFSN